MRISTSQFYAASLTGILNQQNTLGTLSQQLSTGSTLVNPSDQPVAAAQNVALTGQINRLAGYAQNGQNAQNSLQLESATLQSVTTLVSQARQLAVQMNNGTVSSQDLQNAAATMQGYVQQLAQYANTQDGQGNYLFAGSKSGAQPFVIQADGSVQYQGDGGQNQLALGPNLNTAIGDPGNALFMNARAGNGTFSVNAASSNTGGATAGPGTVNNTALAQQTLQVDGTQYQISFSGSGGSMTYSVASGTGGAFSASPVASGSFTPGMSISLPPGNTPAITVPIVGTPASGDSFTIGAAAPQSLFQTFQSLAQAFSASAQTSGSNALRAQSISNALASLDQSQTNLLSAQASIGSRLQQVQAVQTQNSSLTLQLQTQQTQLTSINYPQVITEYQSSLTALQAAQKAFTQVQGLSLFQYL
ncbi:MULTISPECIES: flagellar hook-associated protein FlgL [unclassified Thiomonas]|uniref:flagellar hook-associated protein FlgL n=1 Tax=unclassified Thiomonas TaxID=2625466 RepID=UPI0004DBA6A3|nr:MULTISPECIES: flagellar hook-associated protein FlgL [unclassified Thiomonas]OYV29759.1 MAG: flagellar hook-associated protein 3 [Thiomonas sp. 20-64-9]CDW95347.1 putative flagellin FlgL [Thiomonas sp. CB2]VDY03660.1 putative flagellin FlgL [Thiomonas sp. Bio17B3]VDY09164.1 putative flagellin FlgL [Thiomonas sp. Sup16B3]VDY11909.1 putative flagellin FlgL [Thiomonas sp. OC7]